MARGNQGQRICVDDSDRDMWLATVREAWRRTGWRILAWVLISKHLLRIVIGVVNFPD